MAAQAGTQGYALFVNLWSNGKVAPVTGGWRTLVESDDPEMLALYLRRQDPCIRATGGVGMLARIRRGEGAVEVTPLMDNVGNFSPDTEFNRVPPAMSGADAAVWCELVERHVREMSETRSATAGEPVPAPDVDAPGVPRHTEATGKAPSKARGAPSRSGGARIVLWAAGCIALFLAGAGISALFQMGLSSPADGGHAARIAPIHDSDLAEGGTVRRLQGVSQATGDRY